jgi:upstream activation factor subunit UAF30
MAKCSGVTAPQPLSKDLSIFTGKKELSRGEVMKKIWQYIKLKGLQNPKDKREILCDKVLEALLGVKRVNMFKMAGLLSKHIG